MTIQFDINALKMKPKPPGNCSTCAKKGNKRTCPCYGEAGNIWCGAYKKATPLNVAWR